MTTRYKTRVLTVLVACALMAGCSLRKAPENREYSLGTNGTLVVAFDSQRRVRELRQFNRDGSPKLRAMLVYGTRDMQQFVVFDAKNREVAKTAFSAGSQSSTGRGSEIPSPGWDIRVESSWNGMPGDIHDTVSWFCTDQLLYRVRRTWPDDRSRVHYEITGPSGIILFTNSYIER